MGDHFVLLVDRLLTESTLEATIVGRESRLQKCTASASEDALVTVSSDRMDLEILMNRKKLLECRICHDEDEDFNMEIPCSCRGSLKFAHRRCVQRWCNEKGDTLCEICQQQFKPGYTSPPPLIKYNDVPMNFRGNWEISGTELHNSQFIAMDAPDRGSLEPDFDEYMTPTSRGLMCCRIVAIIFMLLLVLHHALPFVVTGGDYSITTSTLLIIRTAGILLPICVMVRAFSAIQSRRHQQDPHVAVLNEENDLPRRQRLARFVRVH